MYKSGFLTLATGDNHKVAKKLLQLVFSNKFFDSYFLYRIEAYDVKSTTLAVEP